MIVTTRNFQTIKTFLALNLCQFSKGGSTFSSSEPAAASSDCSRLGNALCLCLPVQPAKLCKSAASRALRLISQLKPSIVF